MATRNFLLEAVALNQGGAPAGAGGPDWVGIIGALVGLVIAVGVAIMVIRQGHQLLGSLGSIIAGVALGIVVLGILVMSGGVGGLISGVLDAADPYRVQTGAGKADYELAMYDVSMMPGPEMDCDILEAAGLKVNPVFCADQRARVATIKTAATQSGDKTALAVLRNRLKIGAEWQQTLDQMPLGTKIPVTMTVSVPGPGASVITTRVPVTIVVNAAYKNAVKTSNENLQVQILAIEKGKPIAAITQPAVKAAQKGSVEGGAKGLFEAGMDLFGTLLSKFGELLTWLADLIR